MKASVKRLVSSLRGVEEASKDVRSGERAALVILLYDGGGGGLEALFVRRRDNVEDPWSGQVAFPGGRVEESDGTLLATALRECLEETGIDVGVEGDVLGAMGEFVPANRLSLKVTPYVALLRPKVEVRLSEELADHFWAPLGALRRGVAEVELPRRERRRVEAYLYGGRVIWGLTAQILGDLLRRLSINPPLAGGDSDQPVA